MLANNAGVATVGLTDTMQTGITGEQAGTIIADAIRQDRFWIFPNGEEFFPTVTAIHAAMFAEQSVGGPA